VAIPEFELPLEVDRPDHVGPVIGVWGRPG
jgi:hypothetical protein